MGVGYGTMIRVDSVRGLIWVCLGGVRGVDGVRIVLCIFWMPQGVLYIILGSWVFTSGYALMQWKVDIFYVKVTITFIILGMICDRI